MPQVATSETAMRTFVREPDRSPQDVVPCDRLPCFFSFHCPLTSGISKVVVKGIRCCSSWPTTRETSTSCGNPPCRASHCSSQRPPV
ncbi:MAG: hypothetical protein CVU58_03630 [Deltaproteobacteria bacterium HGW-Deltaproteobacteria-16]|nr:MAG: hypothetical protein CVU58_03630 [Deltaproteobacteria bacterium HGW-Deltaproteobacteria-16]